MHFHQSTLLCCLLAALLTWGGPLHGDIRYKRIGIEDGISQSSVNCVFQDSRGFMWFGTQAGLNRYDGYSFRVFKHDPSDATSISSNWVWRILEDGEGRIWVATFGGGLNRYDRHSESFAAFRHDAADPAGSLPNDGVRALLIDAGRLWIATDQGLAVMDLESGRIDGMPISDSTLQTGNVLALARAAGTAIWVGAGGGLYRLDTVTRQIEAELPRLDGRATQLPTVSYLLADGGERLWIATSTGLYCRDADGTGFRLHHDAARPHSLPSDRVHALHEDATGILWVGTANGVGRLDPDNAGAGFLTIDRYDPGNPDGISQSYVLSIGESGSGEVWIGTHNGLNRYDPRNHQFEHWSARAGSRVRLSYAHVLAIREDHLGDMWIGTSMGLNRYDPSTGEIRHYFRDPGDSRSVSETYILSIYEDSGRRLWIGTRGGGLNRYERATDTFVRYGADPSRPNALVAPNVNHISEDAQGELWVAAYALHHYREDSDDFRSYVSDPSDEFSAPHTIIFTTHEDRHGRFWVGSAGRGIAVMDRGTGQFYHHRNDPNDTTSLSHDMVLCIFESPASGDLWVATAGGLNCLIAPETVIDPPGHNTYRFRQFGEEDGLPNEVIYGIVEDDAGHLWMSTNAGLARVSVLNEKLEVKTYTTSDGLLSNEFNQNAYYRDSGGWFNFGGVNGLDRFRPSDLRANEFVPPVVLTGFRIINQLVAPARHPLDRDRPAPLNVAISEASHVNLGYRDYLISFEFAALSYTSPEENQYAYMLEGVDGSWIHSGERRFASYTNLGPGEYRFRVKASNNDGVWNEEGVAIDLSVSPPPWRTWWAYLLYLATSVAAIATLIKYQVDRKEREMVMRVRIQEARAEEREQVRRKSSADFHDEAGNLLTKISLFTEVAKREVNGNGKLHSYLERIEENTKILSSRMRDFIWVLDPEKDSLYETMQRLRDFGNAICQPTEIAFRVSGNRSVFRNLDLPIDDRRAILLIFKEAIHNCVKHARCNEMVLGVEFKSNKLYIWLQDDGQGFDLGQAGSGYGLKNMKTRCEKIGADCEVFSRPGEGTRVEFRQLITQMGDAQDASHTN